MEKKIPNKSTKILAHRLMLNLCWKPEIYVDFLLPTMTIIMDIKCSFSVNKTLLIKLGLASYYCNNHSPNYSLRGKREILYRRFVHVFDCVIELAVLLFKILKVLEMLLMLNVPLFSRAWRTTFSFCAARASRETSPALLVSFCIKFSIFLAQLQVHAVEKTNVQCRQLRKRFHHTFYKPQYSAAETFSKELLSKSQLRYVMIHNLDYSGPNNSKNFISYSYLV